MKRLAPLAMLALATFATACGPTEIETGQASPETTVFVLGEQLCPGGCAMPFPTYDLPPDDPSEDVAIPGDQDYGIAPLTDEGGDTLIAAANARPALDGARVRTTTTTSTTRTTTTSTTTTSTTVPAVQYVVVGGGVRGWPGRCAPDGEYRPRRKDVPDPVAPNLTRRHPRHRLVGGHLDDHGRGALHHVHRTTDPLPATSAGDQGLTVLENGTYRFSWKTPSAPGCYRFTVLLADGQAIHANFNLTS